MSSIPSPEFEVKRDLLLAELQRGLGWPPERCRHPAAALIYCNISEATLAADISQQSISFERVQVHYYFLARRARQAWRKWNFPNGRRNGDILPQSTLPLEQLRERYPNEFPLVAE